MKMNNNNCQLGSAADKSRFDGVVRVKAVGQDPEVANTGVFWRVLL